MKLPFDYQKILTYYHQANMIKAGHLPTPRMALIYPSYVCGHHCPGCHYKDWNKEHKESGFIDFDKFKTLLRQLSQTGVEAIEFCGGGEPTVHPDFDSMLACIEAFNFKFGMFTNGENIGPGRAEMLVDLASYIRISIDLEPEWDSVAALVVAKKKSGSDCLIGAKILVNDQTKGTAIVDVGKAIECGVDYVQVKAAKPTDSPLSEFEKDKFNRRLGNYKKHYPNIIVGSLDHSELKGKCWLSPIHTMIDVYGDVYLCCYFQFREDSHKIGNCFKEDFDKVWYSDKHWKVIKQIKIEECNVFDCRFHNYNKEMEEALESGHLEFC